MLPALRIRRSQCVSIVLVVGLIMLVAIGLPGVAPTAAGQQDGSRSAWQRANQASSYRFTAHIGQTFLPRAVASMIGQQNQQVNLDMDGAVQQPDRSRVNLRMESQSGNPAPVTVLRNGNKSFIQKGDQLQPADDSNNLAIPTSPNSFADYLSAATNVRQSPDASNPQLTHYLFDLDPTLLFSQLIARVAPGDSLRPILPAAYSHMSGSGELWVDANGLPQRQMIHLSLPQVTAEYDAQVQFTLNLSDWNRVPPLPVPVQNSQGVWQLQPGAAAPTANSTPIVPPVSPETRQTAVSLIVFTLIAIVFSLWYIQRRKAATGFLIFLVCFALTFAMPLQLLAQSIGSANPKASIADALGLAVPAPSAQQQAVDRIVQKYQRVHTSAPTLAQCGGGTPGVDSDHDGLTDQQELCLGTDPYNPDTDGDGVSDYQEVVGFDCDGKHWTTDPLNADSNHDGIPDGQQWPDPNNVAGTCDPTHSGVPKVWNNDNDGDGVPNSIDLSPQAATPYTTTFNLQMYYGSPVTDTTYVEIEVRPQNKAHLQYSLTALDWPDSDNQGQIQDLNNSKNDLRLIPMLEVQTNITNTLWASKYGYTVRPSRNGGYLLYVPVQPISDGGLNQAFYGKVAYAPSELAQDQQISWNVRLVWMVEVQNDQYDLGSCVTTITVGNPTPTYSDCRVVETTPQIVQIYRDESFSVTGLKITRSRGFESLVFGTPQYPTEDNYLFQTAFSLSDIFLNYQQVQTQTHASALQEFAYRFSQPGTPTGLRFNLPNTVTVAMSDTVSSHFDEGLSALNQTGIPQFLENYYAQPGQNCSDASGTFTCATIGLATEYTLASHDLSELQYAPLGNLYLTPLTNMPFITQRNVKAIMYERSASGGWSADTLGRELEIIGQRYASQIAALSNTIPNATPITLRAGAYLPYSLFWTGLDATVEIDTAKFLELSPPDESKLLATEITDAFWAEGEEIIESGYDLYELFHPESVNPVLPKGKLGAAVSKVHEAFEANNGRLGKILGGASIGLQIALLASEIANAVCQHYDNEACHKAFEVVEPMLRTALLLTAAAEVVHAFGGLNLANKGLTYLENVKETIGETGNKIAIVGTVISIALDWTVFGLIAATNQGGYGYVPTEKAALAVAIVSTIWSLAVLAISFIPVFGEILAAVINLLDSIFLLATNGRYNLASALAAFFYDTEIETGLDLKDTQFKNVRSVIISPDKLHLGTSIAGNIFHVDQLFTGVVTTTATGTNSDLDQSSVKGYMSDVKSVPGGDGNSSYSSVNCSTFYANVNPAASGKTCWDLISAEFPLTAAVNAQCNLPISSSSHTVIERRRSVDWPPTITSKTQSPCPATKAIDIPPRSIWISCLIRWMTCGIGRL